jgi:hypothetical protein
MAPNTSAFLQTTLAAETYQIWQIMTQEKISYNEKQRIFLTTLLIVLISKSEVRKIRLKKPSHKWMRAKPKARIEEMCKKKGAAYISLCSEEVRSAPTATGTNSC